jgi:hypothetical protein
VRRTTGYAIIRLVDTGIVVVQDGEDTFVRCQRCGLSCRVPPDLPAKAVADFCRQHHADVDLALHPRECPTWASGSVVDVT